MIPLRGWIIPLLAACFLIALSNRGHTQHTHEGAAGKFYQTWMMPDSPHTSCCHDQDCDAAASRFVDGKWQAMTPDGQWVIVPDSKIEQNRDSPDGRSHLCGRRIIGGSFTVFCFVRGLGI